MNTPLTPTRRLAAALAHWLLLLLGLYGAIFVFLSSFPLLVEEGAVLSACAVSALLGLVVFSLPKARYRVCLVLGWLGWLLWMVWMNFSDLVRVAFACAERVGAVFAKKIGMGLVAADFSDYIGDLTLVEERALCTLLCVLVVALLGLFLSWAVVGRKSFWLAFAGTFPILLCPLTITVTPDWWPLMALLLFWAVGVLTRLVARHDPWGCAKLIFLALPSGALLLFLLWTLLPQETYQKAPWISDARASALETITTTGSGLMASGPFSGLTGAKVDVSLDSAGPLRFTGATMLRVESEVTGHIYLRGFSAATYTGKGWEQLTDEDYEKMRSGWEVELPDPISSVAGQTHMYSFPGIGEDAQPLNFPMRANKAHNPDSVNRRFTIDSAGIPAGYVYTPYQLATEPDRMTGAEFVGDAYLARGAGIRRYVLYADTAAHPNSGARLDGDDAITGNAYASFVYDNYLDVPEELLPILGDLLNQSDFEPMYSLSDGDIRYGHQELDAIEVAQAMADILDMLAVYDPETPFTPQGEDFVGYFLTTSHRGYCMHFASAATLMLRYLGIPTRYTAGYTADVRAGETVSVPDENSHAWVEVYIGGYGWQPVEVTPGFEGATSVFAPTTPDSSPAPSHSVPPRQSQPVRPSQRPDAPGVDGGDDQAPAIDWTKLFDPRWILPPIGLLAVCWLLQQRLAYAQNRRRKRFYGDDTNRAVIDMYVYARRLLRYHKGEEMGEVPERLGQKARFSTHTLTEDERIQMLSYTTGLAVRTYYLMGWWRRHFYRYVLGLC